MLFFFLLVLVLLLLINNVISFHNIKYKEYNKRCNINMISRFDQNEVINQISMKNIIEGKYNDFYHIFFILLILIYYLLIIVFQLIKQNPSLKPTKDQACLLLNNMNQLVNSNSLKDVGKFYETLYKRGTIKAFGSMNKDGPLNSLRLPELEFMLYSDPSSVFKLTGVNSEYLENLEIPNYNTRGYTATNYDVRNQEYKTAVNTFIVASLQSILSITLKSTFFDPTMLLLSIMFMTSSIILDGPTMFDGMFSRQLSWLQFRISQLLNPIERKNETRKNAATFLIGYLVGSPIKRFESNVQDLNPFSFFVSPDGPKVDLQDPSLHGQNPNGGISLMDVHGLMRLSATFMASYAIDAYDGKKVQPLNSYMKNLLAIIGLRSTKQIFSTIENKDFPQKLIPTMTIWGFLQSYLILKEVGSNVLEAVVEVFERGGGVGDAIFAIEANLPADYMTKSPTATRHQIRKMTEDAFCKARKSIVPTLKTILDARLIPDEEEPITDDEIKLIPGTDRSYTVKELILRPNPTMADVDECAKTLMYLLQKFDKKKYGKVLPETNKRIKDVASQVLTARMAIEVSKVENEIRQEKAEKYQSSKEASEVGFDIDAAYQSLGLTKALASFLAKNSKTPLAEILVDPFIDLSNVKSFLHSNANKVEEWWLFYGSIMYEHMMGINNKKFISSVWDSSNLNTGIIESDTKSESNTGANKNMAELTKDLTNIVKASYDNEVDALLAQIKQASQKATWQKLIEENKGVFNSILKDEEDKNTLRAQQIFDRIAKLQNKDQI